MVPFPPNFLDLCQFFKVRYHILWRKVMLEMGQEENRLSHNKLHYRFKILDPFTPHFPARFSTEADTLR